MRNNFGQLVDNVLFVARKSYFAESPEKLYEKIKAGTVYKFQGKIYAYGVCVLNCDNPAEMKNIFEKIIVEIKRRKVNDIPEANKQTEEINYYKTIIELLEEPEDGRIKKRVLNSITGQTPFTVHPADARLVAGIVAGVREKRM